MGSSSKFRPSADRFDGIFLIAIGFGGRDMEACTTVLDTDGMGTGEDGRVASGEAVPTNVSEDVEVGDACGCGSTCVAILKGFNNQAGANFEVNDVREEFLSRAGSAATEFVGEFERAERVEDREGDTLSPLDGCLATLLSSREESTGGSSTISCRGLSSIGVILLDIVDSRIKGRLSLIER
jgi:hypothetical protein